MTTLIADTVASFLLAFTALLSIVNPFGGALIYSQVTAGRRPEERASLAWRVAVYAAGVMIGALWLGAPLLGFFGISLAALRIAGGFVVGANAWEMLHWTGEREERKQQQAQPASGGDDVAFFPLTIPFTTGPGTISVAIALSANGPPLGLMSLPFITGVSAAALAVALMVGLCYASADRIVGAIGEQGSRVLTRLAAFLLLCVGVQIALTGIIDAFGVQAGVHR